MSGSVSTVSLLKTSVLEGSGLNNDKCASILIKKSISSNTNTELLLNYVLNHWSISKKFVFCGLNLWLFRVITLALNDSIDLHENRFKYVFFCGFIEIDKGSCVIGI